MIDQVLQHPDFWKYVSIPLVAAFVGWSTNWVAVKLTFLPLEFIGWKPFLGWQGIIPSKASKMAETFMDSTMSRLGTLPEVFEHMEPEKISAHIVRSLDPRMDEITDEIMLETNPVLWENLLGLVRDRVYERVRERLPHLVENLVSEIGENVEEVVDLKHMIVNRLVSDKVLLNRLFLESGSAEFKFIIRSGFYFGFLFGLVQLAVWIFFPLWWILPVFGLLVGLATNWIALNLIFRPLEPKKMGPFTLQGLFLKRQKEVAGVWCHIVTREILTLRALTHSMLSGPKSERSHSLIKKHIKPIVDEAVGVIRPVAQVAVGLENFARIKEKVGEKALDVSADPFDNHIFIEDRAIVVEGFMRERMESLPPAQFQDLLRPCFQEDEFKLILVGGVLGALAGIAQLVLVFGV
ncbi:MAG: hypothetical protein K0U98_04825 [Deltaproteobacteria bacterium]|nr:hypothetical protein [Deltaproteobacteria bacterium]